MMMMMTMVIIVHHMVNLIIWFIYIWFMWQIITDINGLMQSHGLMVNFTGLRIQVLVAKVCDVFIISLFNITAGYISFKNMEEKSKDLSITKFIKRLAQK